MIMQDVFNQTNITATCGIGTNLYLAKVALDILAKHQKDNIAMLNEKLYQKYLWHYLPLTDFWHIGRGISNHLSRLGINDMYDLAHYREDVLYKEFGINAEYIIDHAWGKEPTTISEIKQYKPQSNSISHSQVLFEDYEYQDALLVLKEMVEVTIYRLIENHLVSDHISLSVGYSKNIIRGTGGSRKISVRTNSLKIMTNEFVNLFIRTTSKEYPIRTIAIGFGNLLDEFYESYDLFTDFEELDREKRLQEAIIQIKHRYGKNAILKGMNKLEKATTEKRNTLIGGHNA